MEITQGQTDLDRLTYAGVDRELAREIISNAFTAGYERGKEDGKQMVLKAACLAFGGSHRMVEVERPSGNASGLHVYECINCGHIMNEDTSD